MEGSGCIGYSAIGSEHECGSGSHNGTETTVITSQHPYAFAFLLVQLIGTVAITVPAVVVIATIVYQKLLSKSHYGFVIGLMVCDIITALSFLYYIHPCTFTTDLLLLKQLSPVIFWVLFTLLLLPVVLWW